MPADDEVSCAINAAICAMREAFAPSTDPLGGGSEQVRFFAGDRMPIELWDAHKESCGCDEPFLWVRLLRRYRSNNFPTEYVGPKSCPAPVVIALEVGVGRCAVIDAEPTWADYQQEAEISLDDSWRIERALCRTGFLAQKNQCADQFATDAIIPYGPEGGVIAWTGTMYIQIG